MTVFAIIPVKRLNNAKSRLSSLLTDDERKQLCLKMLEDILKTLYSTKRVNKTVVISDDTEVFHVTKNFATYLRERKTGMNEAVSEAVGWCIGRGATSVLVLPSDIPLVTPMDLNRMLALKEKASMIISPSRNGRGTNALLLTPPDVSPTFYGPQSFQRHLEEASKRKVSFLRFRSQRIALDIDTVDDLTDFVSTRAKWTSAYKLLDIIGIPNKLVNVK
jgi:2-phospho-L-lactate guanylyltransferase